jgi:multipile epidermal growth factor-like domains protein 8
MVSIIFPAGEKCNCANNTESDSTCSAKYGKNASNFCWMSQCSKCKDTFVGHPTDGHQCYKQITVESKMCFDAKSIDECKIKPQPLRPGQTVFFMVQPRFMNVDIRIVVDVTQGELDFFMSPQDDSFIVASDNQTGQQEIYLDTNYQWLKSFNDDTLTNEDIMELMNLNSPQLKFNDNNFENITPSPLNADEKSHWSNDDNNCKTMNGRKFYVKDQFAKDLSTYITLHHCNTLLRVYGLKNRLVLTLPQNAHNLSGTRFFIILKASSAADSYGLIFFRQDQLHIDLFVFFSVFFSCFFLFLAVCVVAWKAKQASDMRRARRRHVVEMLHMAKRPFAKITLTMGSCTESPTQNRKRRKQQPQSSHTVTPIAIEPTADNLAAIRTVFVRLPGKYKAPVRLAIGSSLISINRTTYPSTSRTFLRRRGSHNQPQLPLQIHD